MSQDFSIAVTTSTGTECFPTAAARVSIALMYYTMIMHQFRPTAIHSTNVWYIACLITVETPASVTDGAMVYFKLLLEEKDRKKITSVFHANVQVIDVPMHISLFHLWVLTALHILRVSIICCCLAECGPFEASPYASYPYQLISTQSYSPSLKTTCAVSSARTMLLSFITWIMNDSYHNGKAAATYQLVCDPLHALGIHFMDAFPATSIIYKKVTSVLHAVWDFPVYYQHYCWFCLTCFASLDFLSEAADLMVLALLLPMSSGEHKLKVDVHLCQFISVLVLHVGGCIPLIISVNWDSSKYNQHNTFLCTLEVVYFIYTSTLYHSHFNDPPDVFASSSC